MMWTETSQIACEHPSFKVPSQAPIRSFRMCKSSSVKMTLGGGVCLMLLKKQRKKINHICDMDCNILHST